jgi:amino acid adenylation domain-containing protein
VLNHNLTEGFYECAVAEPNRTALVVDGSATSYGVLAEQAARVAGWLHSLPRTGGQPRVGVLASRNVEAYAAVLGAGWAGCAYVPVNPKLPDDRMARVFNAADLSAVITDRAGGERLTRGVEGVVPPDVLNLGLGPPAATPLARPVALDHDALAYVMFTSGTTGTPKGVMVTAGNVGHALRAMGALYDIGPNDRLSQYFELSFDLSVFDIFTALGRGASLHVVPATELMAPARFIQSHELTVWFAVPSVINFMQRVRQLKAGAFPTLRVSMFCGEALPLASARAWREAAPNGVLDNHYGPTEATIACTFHRFDDDTVVTPERSVISIGTPYPGMHAAVLDHELGFAAAGEVGELALSGPQVMAGYFRDPEQTERRCPWLIHPTLGPSRWYLTGDLARQDQAGYLHHLGRADNQVKVLGNRVELEDIESHLRAVTGSDAVATVAWPVEQGVVQSLIAFVSGSSRSVEETQAELRQRLPVYMVPKQLILLEALPLNSNGKIDRKALVQRLENEAAHR